MVSVQTCVSTPITATDQTTDMISSIVAAIPGVGVCGRGWPAAMIVVPMVAIGASRRVADTMYCSRRRGDCGNDLESRQCIVVIAAITTQIDQAKSS